MREPREPTHFETRPTDDVGEVVGLLWVNEQFIKADTAIVTGTTLQNFLPGVLKDDAISRGFGSYLLTASAGKQDGYHGYLFAKPKTARQMTVPFRSTTTMMEVPWQPVLRNLHGGTVTRKLETESGATGGSTTSNTVKRTEFQDRYELIPGGTFPTEVVIEEFYSPTPWTVLEAETPVPTTVRYFYKGAQLSLDCLHDDVFIPDLNTSFEREDGFGMRGAGSLPGGQFFPRTNMLGWVLYTLRDTQELVNGVYKRTRIRITQIPPLPEALRF